MSLQKDLFTKRWRTVRAPEPSELQFQISLVAHLRWRARADVEFWATPNGELRDKVVASKLKAAGVLAGVPDLTLEWGPPPQTLHLELKVRARRPTLEQLRFGERARARGHHWEWVDNIDDALDLLKRYGILVR